MKINSLGVKIGSGFMISALLLSTIVGVTLYLVSNISNSSENLFDTDVPINHHSLNIQVQVNRSQAALQAWIYQNKQSYNQEFTSAWKEIHISLNQLSQLVASSDDKYTQQKLTLIEQDLKGLEKHQMEVRDIAHSPDNQPGMKILTKQAAPLVEKIYDKITSMIENQMESSQLGQRNLLMKNMADFRGSMANSVAAIRGFLLTANVDFKSEFERFWTINETSFNYLSDNLESMSKSQQKRFTYIQQMRSNFSPLVDQMFTLRQSQDWDLAQKWLKMNVAPVDRQVRNHIENLVNHQKGNMDTSLELIKGNYSSLLSITSVMLLIGLCLCFGLAFYITKLVVKPLSDVIHLANNISGGDLTKKIDLKGALEIEQLSFALQNMVNVLSKVTSHANAVAKGNYQQDFIPQSELDHLGHALKIMTTYLRKSDQKNNEQDWFKTGQSGMGDCIRGCDSIDELCDQSMNYLCRYLNAKIGAFYLKEHGNYRLSSSFAYLVRSSNDNEFVLGEGMVGQAAKERKLIVFDNVPDKHIVFDMNSGIGDSAPQCIVVFPLIDQQSSKGDVVGVISLGFSQNINKIELELLNKLSSGIASAITSAKSQLKLRNLLEESQQQTEQLKEQQDELTASNAELEEQAMNLSQAEEELRAQREDLQRSNESLREKTAKLELNNKEIESKNKAVETTKKELEKRAVELEQASKYKSEFLANMSHELRTPLNSLLILSQIMAENKTGNLSDEQVSDIKMIHDGGESLLTLINDILDLSKVEAGKLQLVMETIDIHHFGAGLASQFNCLAVNKGIEFKVITAPELPKQFNTDKLRLEQILRNLISNAIKFTESGQVTLNIGLVKNKDELSDLDIKYQDEDVMSFSVIDTGVGIANEKQADIFEAFQQGDGSTSRKFGGTGLGLTISRELSHLLGAEITLESEEGKGSTFTLYLPVEKVKAAEQVEVATETVISQSNKNQNYGDFVCNEYLGDDRDTLVESDCVILIVEDDKAFAKTLQDFAHNSGFKSLVTNKGIEALELVMKFSPHAVILDLGLPDMDGIKVLDGLKQSPMTKDIPVHIISAQDSDEGAINKGAISFLSKPASVSDLDSLFSQFMEMSLASYRQILLVEDDEMSCHAIRSYLEDNHIAITSVHDELEGLELLKQHDFDCIVLDLNLNTMSGQDWLDQAIAQNETIPPVIIYTGKDLSNEEYQSLQQYTDSIVIKGGRSQDRLKDEVSLFLYDVENKRKAKYKADSDSVDDEEIELDLTPIKFDGKRVLVVDDDIRNVYALSKVLKEYGMDVIIADNGELALNKLNKEQDIDLILMDIMMPKMDGFEAIKHIRSKFKNIHPIIALTAKAMPEDRENCINAGANDYLAKPVDINKLVSMVKVWLYQ